MSEPLTSHEIEDVLSSIRRLVSADLRPTLKPPANAASVDKLLLTPSLRVVENPASPAETAAKTAAEPPEKPAAYMLVTPSPKSAPQADDHDAPMALLADEEIQVFFGEAAPLGRSRGGEDYDDEYPAEGGTGLRVVLDSRQPAGTAPDAARHDGPLTLEQPIRDRAALPEVDWGQSADELPRTQAETFAPASAPRCDPADEPLAKAWADRAEAQIKAELTRPDEAPSVAAAQETLSVAPRGTAADLPEDSESEEDAWLDEEVLRDLVTEIIRKELAGTLGERITRNVRKLVRLEVNRALTTRDFE